MNANIMALMQAMGAMAPGGLASLQDSTGVAPSQTGRTITNEDVAPKTPKPPRFLLENQKVLDITYGADGTWYYKPKGYGEDAWKPYQPIQR